MNALQSVFFEYGIYIISGAAILITIAVIALSNAEDCPHPAECFDCSNTSCRGCSLLFLEMRPEHNESIPIAAQPIFDLQFGSVNEKELYG